MLKINGIIPHPQLNYNWQISKIITFIISLLFILVNITINLYNKNIIFDLYIDIFKILDLVSILSILFFKVFIEKNINKNRIFYRKEYESVKFIIFIINFILYGAIVRIIMNYGYRAIYKLYTRDYNLFKLFNIDNINFNLIIILSMAYISIILISLYILFYRKKYISIGDYTNRIINEINRLNKKKKLNYKDNKRHLKELNYSIFNEIKVNKNFKRNIDKEKKEVETVNLYRSKNESKNDKILLENNNKNMKKQVKQNYEPIPPYGIYITEDGKTYINGREVDVFK